MATKNSKKPTKAKKPAAKKVTKVQKKPVRKSAAKKPAKPVKKAAAAKKAPKKVVAKVSASQTDFSAFLKNFQPYRSKKSEKYMNKNQQKHFLGMLTAWKEALIEEQEKTEQLIQQDQSNFPDSLDRAAKEEEFMLELRKRERERKLISKIDLSLKDLEDNLVDYLKDNDEQLKNIDFFNQKELIELISIFKDRSSSLNEIASNVLQMTSVKKNFTNGRKNNSDELINFMELPQDQNNWGWKLYYKFRKFLNKIKFKN